MIFHFELWRLIVYSILAIMAGGCIGGIVTISVFERCRINAEELKCYVVCNESRKAKDKDARRYFKESGTEKC